MRTCLAAFVILALVAAVGCYRGPYTPGTYKAGTTSMERTSKVVYADNLTYKVNVVVISAIPDPDGRLRIKAELENRTGKNLVIQVQTQFRDSTGMLTEDKTNWANYVMVPHVSSSYEAVSMNDKARDYIIRVKLEDRH